MAEVLENWLYGKEQDRELWHIYSVAETIAVTEALCGHVGYPTRVAPTAPKPQSRLCHACMNNASPILLAELSQE